MWKCILVFTLLLQLAGCAKTGPSIPAPAEPAQVELAGADQACAALLVTSGRTRVGGIAFLPAKTDLDGLGVKGTLASGRWLDEAAFPAEAVLGVGLASALGVSVGDELVSQWTAEDGSLASELHQVVGLVGLESGPLDASLLLTRSGDLGCILSQRSEAGVPVYAPLPSVEEVQAASRGARACEVIVSSQAGSRSAVVVETRQRAPQDDGVWLGRSMAESLGVKVGDALGLLTGDATGELVYRSFRVRSVLDSKASTMVVRASSPSLCP